MAKGFPLWLHASGQWCKKHRGQFYYFGTDKDEAEARYLRQWERLKAGRPLVRSVGPITVGDLADRFIISKRARLDSGDLAPVSYGEYRATCKAIIKAFGKNTLVEAVDTDDFAAVRDAAAKRLGPAALGNFIQRVRTIFKYGHDAKLIPSQVVFGPGFAKPSRRAMRRARRARGLKMISPADFKKLRDAAGPSLKAMILLALNCGYGATDCSELPITAMDRPGWIVFPRPKTETPRRCPLWPETLAALNAAIAKRPEPKLREDAGQVFITKYGNRFVRYTGKNFSRTDGVSQEFAKLVKETGVSIVGGFYTLRHVHRTLSDGLRDPVAADLIMGHVDDSMAGQYRERIDDSRLEAITDALRAWAFGKHVGNR